MSVPAVSIVVPTYARPERLAACLEALAALDPPAGGVEVIVVDDGSPVPAEAVAGPFRGCLDLTVLRQVNAGPAAARNAGAAVARGDFLAFTDDDCAPDSNWATALVAGAARHPGALLGGRTVNALAGNPYAEASGLLLDFLGAYFAPGTGRVPLVPSNNLAVPAATFRALGGFDESFALAAGEDRDLCARWHEAGYTTALVPGAVVYHAHQMSLAGFVRQHLAYGRGAFDYHRRRPARRLRPEPLAFYTGLIGYPLRRARVPRSVGLATLMTLSQVANAVGYALAVRASLTGRTGRARRGLGG